MSSGSLLFHHAHGLCTHSNFVAFADPPADVVAYLFPWVEAELVALEARMAQSRLNRDIALQQFLTLLQWLRIVLVQDCALLYTRHPTCPIFSFPPFTFPTFIAFSANATALVTATEEEARLAFHNLPDHMARSMRGYATDLQMKQEQNHSRLCDRLQELQEQTARLELLLGASKGSKRGKSRFTRLDPQLLPLTDVVCCSFSHTATANCPVRFASIW